MFGKKIDPTTPPKRVAIIGAGSAGMAAAYALSNHPDKFQVTIFDKQDVCGGMATSSPIDAEKFGASYINDGVQGGSPQFYNTYKFFEKMGFSSTDVGMQISFGKGEDKFWTNVFPSELVAKHADDIKKFGKVLKIIKKAEPLFAVMSVQAMLKLFRFPQDFGDRLIFPLIALFMGTGNQTPHVSSAILERLFLDPSMSLFEYSPDSLLADIPKMLAFPSLHDVYDAWRKYLEEKGVRVFLATEVTSVLQRQKGNVVLRFKNANPESTKFDTERFDEIIMAVDADSALQVLGGQASWKEKRILGNVKYFNDISVTHHDSEYMKKYYEMEFRESLVAESRKDDPSTQKAVSFAKDEFRPLYFIHMYDQDPKKIEMSFDLTHYQPQFKSVPPSGPVNEPAAEEAAKTKPPPSEDKPHVYQTIFLNDKMQEEWTKGEIDPDKIILEKWWKQQGHNWTHYLGTVPWLWTINGKNHTHFHSVQGLPLP
ncbi:FAD/NAD-binding domain-containing protein [Schizopora paradoxa]|uniref:FAD/NAD-binding domain-containing protein n=1 Tax=Schizopora paradoxa TaxID=27342 RepID=A0A0H2RTT0_9AGAM|nr:FAD/NAD-binding domain-containing protein [Schizopora paradoxa]